MSDRPPCRLYLITPPRIEDLSSFEKILRATLGAGDVACLQLRLKGASDTDIIAAAGVLFPIAQEQGIACLINDRPDLAAECGADGVHIGQSDASYGEARRIVGNQRSVGVTCHDSRHLAMEAAEAGADYVAFGAFFDSATKAPPFRATADILTWWQDIMEVPCVAIGGITPENGETLVRAGADFLAVSAGVWNWPQGPQAAVSAFDAMFQTCA